MFETVTLTYGQESKRVWGTLAGVTGQALLVTCAVVAPMIWPAALPRAAWITGIEAPGPPPAPPPPGKTIIRPKTAVPRPSQFIFATLIAPTKIPFMAATLTDDVPAMAGNGGVASGVAGGDLNAVQAGDALVGSILRSVVKPPEIAITAPPKTAVAPVAKPPRISVVELARPIRRVDPVYPPIARQMRVSGVVELQGVLGIDGRIRELKVLRGHPMLAKAAVDAVSQWTYAATILNGQAVEVVAPITVTFTLN
jgi:protein TonB